ncbi:outer membrane lipoprotein-sorting protein [Pseudoalteromonas sp. MMG013]|uniref:outer membrane lipoprotein-sorting protein n=1 Tax=Pseudoalteromonas sp. MMG013 TaxID=2822687 RepID=UPI001B39102D|nr:outer membrane lipoprotein-sorting protein [Pseudoalteromonas sp. MMG013]MBQ4861088.1 outer membrane lipoprotein-sorting protein [Pseudoalteromonas sp. MMG013]
MKNKVSILSQLLVVSMTLLLAHNTYASSEQLNAEELMGKRKQHNSGWRSSEVALNMVLTMSNGQQSTRSLRAKALEVIGDGDKSLSVFDTPRDVSGVAFLNHSHVGKLDNQWLYLPSLKRVKRISSNNKSSSFMGSEFSYEDMSSFEVEKYTYGSAVIAELEGKQVYVVESIPKAKSSGYSKLKTWLDTTHYQPLKVEFFDKRGGLLKNLALSGYKKYDNGVWRAHQLRMKNIQNARETELSYQPFNFNIVLNDKDFNKNVLKRVR